MRVLHLLSSTGYYGAENMAAELVRGLSGRGVENYVWSLWSGAGSNTDIVGAVRECTEDAAIVQCHGKWDWRLIFELRSYVREHGIEVIHSHKYKTNFYAAAARPGLQCVLVSTCHNWLLYDAKMRVYAALDKIVLKTFDTVVAVSDEVENELLKRLDRDRTVKIDNCVNVDRFSVSISRSEARAVAGVGERPIIGFVGRLTRDKGISTLLRAVHALERRGMSLAVLIVGEGEQRRELQHECASLGIGDNVHFLGQREDMPRLYAAMDVFVLPSSREGFPMVVLEAMASGIPVVATRVGDIPYLLEKGGILVDPGDTTGLADAMWSLVSDPATARRNGLAGQERVRRKFSSSTMAQRYHDMYRETLIRRRGAH